MILTTTATTIVVVVAKFCLKLNFQCPKQTIFANFASLFQQKCKSLFLNLQFFLNYHKRKEKTKCEVNERNDKSKQSNSLKLSSSSWVVSFSICLFICLSVCLSVCNFQTNRTKVKLKSRAKFTSFLSSQCFSYQISKVCLFVCLKKLTSKQTNKLCSIKHKFVYLFVYFRHNNTYFKLDINLRNDNNNFCFVLRQSFVCLFLCFLIIFIYLFRCRLFGFQTFQFSSWMCRQILDMPTQQVNSLTVVFTLSKKLILSF